MLLSIIYESFPYLYNDTCTQIPFRINEIISETHDRDLLTHYVSASTNIYGRWGKLKKDHIWMHIIETK